MSAAVDQPSAAGDAHVAGEGGTAVHAVDDEVVPLRLSRDRLLDGRMERVITFRSAERSAQIGGVFVLEALSVVVQVGYFKATGGQRIFRMAPLHHHFELVGWDEVTVVIRFWIIAGLFVAFGLGVFYAEWVVGGG